MRLIKLWDASDNEILVDMDRTTTPLPYKKTSRIAEILAKFVLFLITGKK